MINHDLIKLLKTFSGEEVKDFRNFLKSPFFNKSSKLLKLYNEIIKHHPDFGNKNFTKENLHKRVTRTVEYKNRPGSPYGLPG